MNFDMSPVFLIGVGVVVVGFFIIKFLSGGRKFK